MKMKVSLSRWEIETILAKLYKVDSDNVCLDVYEDDTWGPGSTSIVATIRKVKKETYKENKKKITKYGITERKIK